MRVIAGELKGHRLQPVPGHLTRPTTDRVKEAMFSILTPYLVYENVLDLFAGTGALGIESLSRGFEYAVFVEKDRKAFAVLEQNLNHCRLLNQARLLKMDAHMALSYLQKQNLQFDLVLLDPPYQLRLGPRMIEQIQTLQLHKPHTVYMVEHDHQDEMPDQIGSAGLLKRSVYGEIALSIYLEGKSET